MQLRRSFVPALMLIAVGCGESEADQANRTALAPLLQRHQALGQEFTDWLKVEDDGNVTWGDTFDRYDDFVEQHEAVLADMRGLVPTERFACISGLLSRSIRADVKMLRARKAYFQNIFAASNATDRAKRYYEQAGSSRYSYDTYREMGDDAIKESQEALATAKSFGESASEAAREGIALADSLAVATREHELLPAVAVPSYPVVTASGEDSLLVAPEIPAHRACSR